jgi:5-hydroxyisourate hydrolase
MKSPITSHVLDTTTGKPAGGVPVQLYKLDHDRRQLLAEGLTNNDGRLIDWWSALSAASGVYEIRFDTAVYFKSIGCQAYFYPEVTIRFEIHDPTSHYHVPLLISPYGFSTYRGS